MKAIVYTKYGPPDSLELKEVEKPVPGNNEVLVKIHAASVNPADLDCLRGIFLVRIGAPPIPKDKILGSDIAGTIEAAGKDVKGLKPGDEVFADLSKSGFGAFAEYVCASENTFTLKPASITFEEASTLSQAGILALQGLRNKRQTIPGHKVLINGAGGSVGTFAVQIAKLFGAEVTGVDSAEKLDMIRSLGADKVIDYTREDFTRNGQQYDLVLDIVAKRSAFAYKRSLSPTGICIFIGGSMPAVLMASLLGPLILMAGKRKMGVLAWQPNKKEDLVFLTGLLESGKVVPVIDKIYPLNGTAEALKYLEDKLALGKLVIKMDI